MLRHAQHKQIWLSRNGCQMSFLFTQMLCVFVNSPLNNMPLYKEERSEGIVDWSFMQGTLDVIKMVRLGEFSLQKVKFAFQGSQQPACSQNSQTNLVVWSFSDHTANTFNVIFTLFIGVPLSTVISLYIFAVQSTVPPPYNYLMPYTIFEIKQY